MPLVPSSGNQADTFSFQLRITSDLLLNKVMGFHIAMNLFDTDLPGADVDSLKGMAGVFLLIRQCISVIDLLYFFSLLCII